MCRDPLVSHFTGSPGRAQGLDRVGVEGRTVALRARCWGLALTSSFLCLRRAHEWAEGELGGVQVLSWGEPGACGSELLQGEGRWVGLAYPTPRVSVGEAWGCGSGSLFWENVPPSLGWG